MNGTVRDPDDDNLRRRFAELRAHHAGQAPRFSDVLDAARARRSRRGVWVPLRMAAGALLVVGAGVVATARLHRHEPPALTVALSDWQSPTAWLLRVPGAAVLDSMPSVTASVIRLELSTPTSNPTSRSAGHTKGDTI